jgi:large subunit ribosomal protein L21
VSTSYAVIAAGGRQYRVAPGDLVRVDRLAAESGSKVDFNHVLLVGSEAGVRIGRPTVEGAVVHGEVIGEKRDKKVMIFKKRRTKTYRKIRGHRQYCTLVRISAIEG